MSVCCHGWVRLSPIAIFSRGSQILCSCAVSSGPAGLSVDIASAAAAADQKILSGLRLGPSALYDVISSGTSSSCTWGGCSGPGSSSPAPAPAVVPGQQVRPRHVFLSSTPPLHYSSSPLLAPQSGRSHNSQGCHTWKEGTPTRCQQIFSMEKKARFFL